MPQPSTSQTSKTSILCQGMVYLSSEQDRPDPSNVLILTAASPSQPNVPILGAKYNVYQAKFPFQFTMGRANILNNAREDEEESNNNGVNIQEEDWIVTARTCPSEVSLPCPQDQSMFVARGISKVLKGSSSSSSGAGAGGNNGGSWLQEGQSIRTPASLRLVRSTSTGGS